MPTSAIPLTLSVGATADITGGSSIGLADQVGVTAIPAFTATVGTATITITPKNGTCTGVAQTTLITVLATPTVADIPDYSVCQG